MKKTLASTTILLSLAFGALLAQDKGGKGGGKGPGGPGLTLSSPDFEDGGIIPDKYSQKGGQQGPSPKLEWKNVPMGTQSFVLLLHDPDVALQKKLDDVTHWLIFNIPGTARASFAMYNTLEEVDQFADALRDLVADAASRAQTTAATAEVTQPAYPRAAAANARAIRRLPPIAAPNPTAPEPAASSIAWQKTRGC